MGTSAHRATHADHFVDQALAHELRETKYMMYVVDAADPFRSIRQPLQVEKMGN